MKKLSIVLLLIFTVFSYAGAQDSYFRVGTGIYDITGPAAETGMMGYARLDQQTSGIHMRLWARAFVIENQEGDRVVFVNTDLGMIMQAVKVKVVEKLQKRFGQTYREENVMLTATHTHGGPGGFSHYALYNITILGYCKQNFNAVVEGIYQSIVRAHNNVAPAKIFIATGRLDGTSKNRSLEAFQANVDSAFYPDYDPEVTVLRFERPNGKEMGMICWFSVHATSMGNTNKLITGDNKGWAERYFEQKKGSDYHQKETFIAAFANSTLGDMSPNMFGGQNGGGINDFASTEISGRKHFQTAWQLYHGARQELIPQLKYRYQYANFADFVVDPQYTDGKPQKTAFAALGLAFAAGAEDGPSNLPYIKEGDHKGHYHPSHGYKLIFLETGKMTPFPWTPEVLPSQIFVIGDLALLAVPGEFTIQSGRRIKDTIREDMAKIGVERIVITGPANAYAGYVTTREEYNEQHYEGASTHFGQWTLAVFRQHFKSLSESLVNGAKMPKGPTPRDLSDKQSTMQPGVVFDAPPLGYDYGDMEKDVPAQAERLQLLEVIFYGAHPKNNLKTNDSFLKIEHKTKKGWQTVRYDYDLDTAYVWERYGVAASKIKIWWDIPADMPTGTYRIFHSGHYKSGLSGEIEPYSGYSNEFQVVPSRKLSITSCEVSGNTVRFCLKYPKPTERDLGEKDVTLTTGKIRFSINGTKTIYEAFPSKGKFSATIPFKGKIYSVSVPAGHATDGNGNGNAAFHKKF